jgi:hypothetical protein
MNNNKVPMLDHEIKYYAIQAINNFTKFTRCTSNDEQQRAIDLLVYMADLLKKCLQSPTHKDPEASIPVETLLVFKEVKEIYEQNFAVDSLKSAGIH